METRPPTITRILVAIGFALSCFALALFLWITFGGPLPLKPEGYRFTVPFDEADAARGGVRRADLRGPGGEGEGGRALRQRARRRDDRARQRLRADPHRHPGDAAHQDPARGDLRRADPRGRAGPNPGGGRQAAGGPGRGLGPARRDLAHLRRAHARRLAGLDAGDGRGASRPRRRPVRRDRRARPLRRGDEPAARRARQPGPRGQPVRARRRHGLRGAIGAPGTAQRPDPELRGGLLDHRAPKPGAGGAVPDPAHLPARVARHPGAPQQLRCHGRSAGPAAAARRARADPDPGGSREGGAPT